MRRRAGRPGLVGTMARTAVIAGTATAVSGNVQKRQAAQASNAQAAAQQQADAAQQAAKSQADIAAMQAQLTELQQPQAATSPEAQSSVGDLMSQLERLGRLKAGGVLTDAEFSAAKAQLLGL